MNYILTDIETAIETVRKLMKVNRAHSESFKIVLEELWFQHNRVSKELKSKRK
jgi:hypothetical protein